MKINLSLDEASIDAAIKAVKELKKSIHESTANAVSEISGAMAEELRAGYTSPRTLYAGDKTGMQFYATEAEASGKEVKSTVIAEGPQILFIEFGTGNNDRYYGDSPTRVILNDPLAARGTYGKGKGSSKYGWWYNGMPTENDPYDTEPTLKKVDVGGGNYQLRYGLGSMHTYGNPANPVAYVTLKRYKNGEATKIARRHFK